MITSACNLTKINTPPWVFFTFLNGTNGTKSRNAPHVFDFKGFGREFLNYEEAQKSQWIYNLLSYLMLRKANNKYFQHWGAASKKRFYKCVT